MLPQFLLPETISREDGIGPEVPCEEKILHLTLGITRVIPAEKLEVSVWGSADRTQWRHLAVFPQKFYCGVYTLTLDLSGRLEVRYLRAQWKMERWGRDGSVPMFGFYLQAEAGPLRRRAGAA